MRPGELLGLGTIIITSRECVAKLYIGAELFPAHVDLGIVLIRPFEASAIEHGRCVFYPRLRHETFRDLVNAGH